jgi:hypothetical protein
MKTSKNYENFEFILILFDENFKKLRKLQKTTKTSKTYENFKNL